MHMYMHTVELLRLSIAECSCGCDLIVNLTLLLCGTTAANQIHAVRANVCMMYISCFMHEWIDKFAMFFSISLSTPFHQVSV